MPYILNKKIYSFILCALLMYCATEHAAITYNLIPGKPNVVLTPESVKIGQTWLKNGVWEQHLIEKFYNLLPASEPFVAFDLGAQTGSFSLLAKYFPQSKWYSFEPIDEAANALKENLRLNGVENVSVQQVAATDFTGVITLNMPAKSDWGLATIGTNVQRFNTAMTRDVNCVTLDSFVQEQGIERVHFMKLDTEGSELSILRGARKMLLRDHPIMIMEYNPINMSQCGFTKEDLHAFLKEMGYQWILISSEDILCTPIAS